MPKEWEPNLQRSDLEALLGEEVIEYKSSNLTSLGDNYGSTMLAVSVTTQSGKELSLVAKMFPRSKMAQEHFQCPLSMRKEIDMYMLVSPVLDKIQEEHSVPLSERLQILCSCPGARLTLKGYNNEPLADYNSVLLLENLKSQGYRTGDRVAGLDLKHTEMVIKYLARFHATTLAVKLQKPDVFSRTVLKACEAFKIRWLTKEKDEVRVLTFVESLRIIPICQQNIDILKEHARKYVEYSHNDTIETPKQPFATIVHNDLWTNNIMFKYSSEEESEPLDVKMLDFQVVRYGSPISDVIFFLSTSTEKGIVSQYLDNILKLYHDSFTHWLTKLGCDPNILTLTEFQEEVNTVAPSEVMHILLWLFPITLHKDQEYSMYSPPNQKRQLNKDFFEKVSELVTEFSKRNWLLNL
ncbi:uncharacterized protein LOC134532339 [Bacillus rossius redtenbacheri]|uniref:uncharacterized protein LOC134532339 n=1 Tax=Bacillus rossius redtenbacheri TaxID=93214 RepID=UPI002FDD10A6